MDISATSVPSELLRLNTSSFRKSYYQDTHTYKDIIP